VEGGEVEVVQSLQGSVALQRSGAHYTAEKDNR
jgi:hypothetical protein